MDIEYVFISMCMFKLLPKEILNAKKTCGIKEEKKSILIFLGYKEIPEAQDRRALVFTWNKKKKNTNTNMNLKTQRQKSTKRKHKCEHSLV